MSERELGYEELSALMKSNAGVSVDAATLAADPDLPFSEHGLDSLGLLGVVTALENSRGIPLGDAADVCKTPRALIEAVGTALAEGA